jgi:hypothetical protein
MQTVALVLAILSPFFLRYAPASLKGPAMAVVAVLVALALGGAALAIDGKFPHNWTDAASVSAFLAALVGAQQTVYALLKDDFKLSTPPPAVTQPPAAGV